MYSKFLKSNKGASVIIFSLALTVVIGMSAIVVDIGNVVVERQKLQNAVDSAALAAAQELPDKQRAIEVANKYIADNGFTPEDINVSFSDDDTKLIVNGNKDVQFLFARILGLDSKNTKCNATAMTGNIGQALDYVLFSGSASTNLIINGSKTYVNGNSHTNAGFIANGSMQTITGACEAVKTVVVNGTHMEIDDRVPNAPYVDMPDFSETIRLQAEKAGTLFDSSKTYNGSNINVDEPIYVNGNINVDGSHFKGKGCILATGDITINGSNLYDSQEDSVCFYSKNGRIIVNGSNIELNGIVYAPNGSIILNGSNQTIMGRVIGKTLVFNGSNLTVDGADVNLGGIPSKGTRLIH
ncbi:MAG: pilus assembly protein TadG-related protein [Bacillota bacterium]|nr:pilus assembly protein TadG-related protein [Bacillota bacterium]